MASTVSPTRRVLAQKSTNASLSPSKRKPDEKMIANTVVQFPSSSIRAGQKRTHNEIEDKPADLFLSQIVSTQTMDDVVDVVHKTTTSPSAAASGSADNNSGTTSTAVSSFNASQSSLSSQEELFEIHEEISQKTLEKLHATPVDQSLTSSQLLPSLPMLHPSLAKDVSNLSQSSEKFSSYIQLPIMDVEEIARVPRSDGHESVVDGDLAMLSPPLPAPGSHLDATQEEKSMLADKAEMLRTRLQLAFYKVQTKQTSKPFAYVLPPQSQTTSSPELPPAPLPPNAATYQYQFHTDRNKHLNSPESKIAAARARATMQPKPAVRPLNSLRVPKMVPTAYSARKREVENSEVCVQIPSSPPPSHGNDMQLRMHLQPQRATTPTRHSENSHLRGGGREEIPLPTTPMQLGSPPGSDADENNDDENAPRQTDTARKIISMERTGITSSVAKGEAANGLLELMKAASQGRGHA